MTWHRLGELYLRGFLVLLGILLIWYLIDFLWNHVNDVVASPGVVNVLFVAFFLLPLPLGWIQHNLLRKMFERQRSARALARMEDRLVAELSLDDRQGYPVVLVNIPSEIERSLGLVTAVIAGKEPGSELASVFLPRGPGHGLRGSIRIINVEDLEFTDWSLHDFLQHHFSYGSSSPGHFDKDAG